MSDNKDKTNRKAEKKPVPVVLSINICDMIIRDERTKKVSLIGLFSVIRAQSFPVIHSMMHVYVEMTNGHGTYEIEIRFSSMDEGKPIAVLKGPLEFQNPLQVASLNLSLKQLKFDAPGDYLVEVLCHGKKISDRKFKVLNPNALPPTNGTRG